MVACSINVADRQTVWLAGCVSQVPVLARVVCGLFRGAGGGSALAWVQGGIGILALGKLFNGSGIGTWLLEATDLPVHLVVFQG